MVVLGLVPLSRLHAASPASIAAPASVSRIVERVEGRVMVVGPKRGKPTGVLQLVSVGRSKNREGNFLAGCRANPHTAVGETPTQRLTIPEAAETAFTRREC